MQDIRELIFRVLKKDFCVNSCKMYKTNRTMCKKLRKGTCYPNMRKTVNAVLEKFNVSLK